MSIKDIAGPIIQGVFGVGGAALMDAWAPPVLQMLRAPAPTSALTFSIEISVWSVV